VSNGQFRKNPGDSRICSEIKPCPEKKKITRRRLKKYEQINTKKSIKPDC
jgi:hypothetical protein